MTAGLLSDETLTLGNLPHLADIATLATLLAQHCVEIEMRGGAPNGGHTGKVLALTARNITSTTAPGPSPHCPDRATMFVAVGKENTGPNAQVIFPGFAFVKYACS